MARLAVEPVERCMLRVCGPPDAEEQAGSGFSTLLPEEVEECSSGDEGRR